MISIWKLSEKALVIAGTRIPVVEFVPPFFGNGNLAQVTLDETGAAAKG